MCDALAYQSVKLLADIAGDLDAATAAELSAECAAWRKDIVRVLDEAEVRNNQQNGPDPRK